MQLPSLTDYGERKQGPAGATLQPFGQRGRQTIASRTAHGPPLDDLARTEKSWQPAPLRGAGSSPPSDVFHVNTHHTSDIGSLAGLSRTAAMYGPPVDRPAAVPEGTHGEFRRGPVVRPRTWRHREPLR